MVFFLLGWIDVEVAHTVLSVATTHSIFSFAVNGMRNSFMVCDCGRGSIYIEIVLIKTRHIQSHAVQYTCSTHAVHMQITMHMHADKITHTATFLT